MKKIIFLPIIISLIFSSCIKQSRNCDIFEFEKRFNKIYNEEKLKTDELYFDKKNILYWCFDKNTCVSFYLNSETGNIEKCNIVFNNMKINSILINNIKNVLFFNNEYMTEYKYKTEKYYMITFEDQRYITESSEPFLKKEIKEEELY